MTDKQAFPTPGFSYTHGSSVRQPIPGMLLRTYVAVEAMKAILSNEAFRSAVIDSGDSLLEDDEELVARRAFAYADALLKEEL